MPPGRAKQELATVERAAADVTSNQIGVHVFEICRSENAAGENGFAEAGREALDLIFEALQQVDFRSVGNMTVGPRDVFTSGSAGWIEQSGLSEKNERFCCDVSAARGLL